MIIFYLLQRFHTILCITLCHLHTVVFYVLLVWFYEMLCQKWRNKTVKSIYSRASINLWTATLGKISQIIALLIWLPRNTLYRDRNDIYSHKFSSIFRNKSRDHEAHVGLQIKPMTIRKLDVRSLGNYIVHFGILLGDGKVLLIVELVMHI